MFRGNSHRMIAIGATLFAAGCGDFQKAMNQDRQPVTLPNMAPAGLDPANPGTAASVATQPPVPASPAAGTPSVPPAGAAGAGTPPASNTGIIGKTTATVVDKGKAMAANPRLVEVPNSLQGGDPVSLAASAYISLRSRASTLGFQSELKNFKALNDRNPTYDELMGMMKQHGVAFAMLPPYQTYGYDERAGALVILEDREDKARRYQAAGIPLE